MRNSRCVRFSLLVLLLGYWIGFARENFAADKLRISYSAVNATQAFLWVAQEKGIFAKHGLEGELLYINSGTMNIAALVGGSVQIARGGPVSIEARLHGVKLTILGNPLPWLASNLVVHPDIKGMPDLAGKFAGISRFGSSTDQGFRYLFRKNNLNVDRDLKMLQMGGDSSRVGGSESGHDPIHLSRRRCDRQCPRSGLSRSGHRTADVDPVSLDICGRRRELAQ